MTNKKMEEKMNTNKMNDLIADTPQQNVVKIAGIMFLLTLVIPLFNWIFVLSRFIVPDDAISTANNIMANELLFRIGIINELIISVIVVGLALTLYIILKSVNKNIALLALFLKLIEAILIAVIALGHSIALLVLNGQASLTVFEPKQIQALVGLFLNVHISITAIPGLFLGLSLVIFLYLLFKSKYVPGILAAFGVLSYALIFIYDLLFIFSPNYATILIIQIIGWGPSILFEIIIGLWLLIKGVNVKEVEKRALTT